jgi:ABC-type transport system substrate-binding protein
MLPYYRYMTIMPVESESAFNIKSEMRGTGAWRLESYKPSQSVHYSRNPDWYDADKVKLDGIDLYIVTEYATGLAQLRGGNLWTYAVRPEDLITTKRDVPQLVMQSETAFSRSISPYVAFGVLPGSPFIDDRVRKAVSMLIDRDLWIDTFYNVSNFEKEGLLVPTRWNSHTPCGDEAYWVDPKGNDLGEGARYFRHDAAEAKKLLRAAGQNSAIQASINYTPNGYSPTYIRQAEVFRGMWEAEGDFKLTTKTHDYTSVWVPNYHQGNGKYEGIVVGAVSTLPDIDGTLVSNFRSGSVKTWSGLVDPKLDAIIDRQRRELNREKRIDTLKEFQRYEATQMHSIISPGEGLSFTLAWPWLGNRGVYSVSEANSAHQESTIYLWYDASKKKA